MNENAWLDLSLSNEADFNGVTVLWPVDSRIGQRPRQGLVLEQVLH